MTTVAAGQTGTYTFNATANVAVDLAANERALVEVRRNGNVIYSSRLTSSRVIGPFLTGDGMLITADGPAIDYTVNAQNGSLLGIVDTLNTDLPSASVLNQGLVYFVTDENGGTLRKSSGSSMVKMAPGVTEANIGSAIWTERGTAATNATKFITDLGNNATVEAIYDGARWQPRGGEQLIYNLKAPIVGATSTSSSVTFPSVTIPGNLMGTNGAIRVEVMGYLDAASLTTTDSLTIGGTAMMNNTNDGTNRRRYWTKELRNRNATNSQIVTTRASGAEYGSELTAGTAPTTLSKDTTGDLTLAGSIATTSTGAQTFTLDVYRVWWIAG